MFTLLQTSALHVFSIKKKPRKYEWHKLINILLFTSILFPFFATVVHFKFKIIIFSLYFFSVCVPCWRVGYCHHRGPTKCPPPPPPPAPLVPKTLFYQCWGSLCSQISGLCCLCHLFERGSKSLHIFGHFLGPVLKIEFNMALQTWHVYELLKEKFQDLWFYFA